MSLKNKRIMDFSEKPVNRQKLPVPRLFLMGYAAVGTIRSGTLAVYAEGAGNSGAAAGSDIFSIARNAMQSVYTDVAGIATVAAVACAAVCLFLMNFSKSGRTVDESRAWLKRIVICWAALMTLGAIVTYFQSIIPTISYTG